MNLIFAMLWWACASLFVLVLISVSVQCEEKDSRVVHIAQGNVRGYKRPGEDLFVFYNIRYATAPTGRHKFKDALPPPVYKETFDAVDKGIICPQAPFPAVPQQANKTQIEDCLLVNIYVPDTKKNLPVVVIFHGGAFQFGWGDMYTPINWVKQQNILAVTFNYRLGPYGFLCLGTEYAPGNAGMKDQVAALKWVKENIKAFGGNPDDVTITGYSAGSAAVELILLSGAADGLYNKVIVESSGGLDAYAVSTDPIKTAKEVAKQMNFVTNTDNVYALEEYYTNAPQPVLTTYSFINRRDSTFTFAPCVERDIGQKIFLHEPPIDILRSGRYRKVPLLYGFSNLEGLFRGPMFEQWKNEMNANFSRFLPADLHFENLKQREKVAQKIKEFYFGDEPVSEKTFREYVNYHGDVLFKYGLLRAIELYVEAGHNEIYLYEYSYGPREVPNMFNLTGANHVGESSAIYDGYQVYLTEDQLTEEYLKVKRMMRELWANFVRYGTPVPEGSHFPAWLPVEEPWSPHMSLNKKIKLRGQLQKERTVFLNHIYEEFYHKPSPPPPQPPRPRIEL